PPDFPSRRARRRKGKEMEMRFADNSRESNSLWTPTRPCPVPEKVLPNLIYRAQNSLSTSNACPQPLAVTGKSPIT
ncbi:9278_t:CDS:2, partial [Acaulospora colombiana]